MLLGNYSVLEKTPGRWMSGGATGQGLFRASANKTGANTAMFGDAIPATAAFPYGYDGGAALRLARAAGGVSSVNTIVGQAMLVSAGAMGLNAESTINANGSLSATGQLVVSAVAAIVGTGALTGSILAALLAAASLTASGSTTAAMAALGWALCDLEGAASLSVTLNGTGELAASINVAATADLTAPGIASELLDEQLVETGLTVRETLRLCVAALAGKVSGAAGSTITIRSAVADDADRIVATVDSNGNRAAITYDLG